MTQIIGVHGNQPRGSEDGPHELLLDRVIRHGVSCPEAPGFGSLASACPAGAAWHLTTGTQEHPADSRSLCPTGSATSRGVSERAWRLCPLSGPKRDRTTSLGGDVAIDAAQRPKSLRLPIEGGERVDCDRPPGRLTALPASFLAPASRFRRPPRCLPRPSVGRGSRTSSHSRRVGRSRGRRAGRPTAPYRTAVAGQGARRGAAHPFQLGQGAENVTSM